MGLNRSTSYAAEVQNYYSARLLSHARDGSHITKYNPLRVRSTPWQPIQYTSLKGWMFLNYLLLVLLLALPILLISWFVGAL